MVSLLTSLTDVILGYCPLFDLVHLYQVDEAHTGLDLVQDTLFDAMHIFFCHGTC